MTRPSGGRLDCRLVALILNVIAVGVLVAIAIRNPRYAAWLVAERSLVEWVQVFLMAVAGALALGQAWTPMRRGEPVALEVAIAAYMAISVIGEVDLDRMIFGVKVVSTRFFLNPTFPLVLRVLAATVIVGFPVAMGYWLLRHVRELVGLSLAGLRQPWGQLAGAGAVLYLLVQVFEKPLDHIPYQPKNFIEEVLEFVAAILIFVGCAARRRGIISRMSSFPWIAVAVAVLGLYGCSGDHPASAAQDKPKPSGPPPREVRVVPVAEQTVPRTVVANGTLAAQDQVVLGTKVVGRLAEISVDLGSRVLRGQAIAKQDQSDFKLRVDQAEAALYQARVRLGLSPSGTDERVDPEQTAIVRQARAVRDEARLTRDRGVKLLEQELIARAQLDTAEANLQVAEGRHQDAMEEVRNRQGIVAQRRSELELARQQLSDTVIVSPIDGAVSLKQASVGEYLGAGAPVATLVRLHPLRLRVPVPEREGSSVRAGQAVRLTVEGDPTVYAGRVVRLSPIVQEQNRTVMVEAEVPNERGVLRPGSFARADIVTEASQPVVIVPASSIIVFAGVEKVLVVRAGRTAEVRVQTGRRLGDNVEIVDGLKRGEAVVSRPGNLTGGQPVTVAP